MPSTKDGGILAYFDKIGRNCALRIINAIPGRYPYTKKTGIFFYLCRERIIRVSPAFFNKELARQTGVTSQYSQVYEKIKKKSTLSSFSG
jgi:hypothetical protein